MVAAVALVSYSRFRSAEEFERGISTLIDGECTQSTPGATDITLLSHHEPDCVVLSCRSNRRMLLRGTRSPDFWTLSPVGQAAAGGRFHGRNLEAGDLLMLDPGGEAYQQVFEEQSQLAVSVSLRLVEKILEVEHHRSADSLLRGWKVKADPDASIALQKILQQTLSSNSVPSPGCCGYAPGELPSRLLALAIGGQHAAPARSTLIHRRRVVSKAEELMRSRLHAPPTVMALCEATNTSRRALFYAFESLLGRSPIQHANILRLDTARRRLVRRGSDVTVKSVAEGLGFWYPGQFSADYRRLFGELPSATKNQFCAIRPA